MNKKSILRIIFILAVIGLTASLFAFSISACDVNDDEAGLQPFHTALLPTAITSPILAISVHQLAIELHILEPNSAILYLELHETSPPQFFA